MARSLYPRSPDLNMAVFDPSGARVDEAAPEPLLDNIFKSFDGPVAVDHCQLVPNPRHIFAFLRATSCPGGGSRVVQARRALGCRRTCYCSTRPSAPSTAISAKICNLNCRCCCGG